MGDAFEDRLQLSLKSLRENAALGGKIDVPPERQFIGFDAYEKVLASDIDVVLLTTPPHFRPLHLKAAIEAGKHVFAEKPVAVDAPGVHRLCRLVPTLVARGYQSSRDSAFAMMPASAKRSSGCTMVQSARFTR